MNLKVEIIETKDSSGRELYRLIEELDVMVCDDFRVIVPRGFVTNFGTIPRFFYRLIRPVELRSASVVHDYLLNELPEYQEKNHNVICSRWLADAVLYDLLIQNKFGRIKSIVVWTAVRLYGVLKK